jgi:pilus assembly protein CpaC
VSSLDYSNAVTLQGVQIPAVSTRRAETEIVLREGESFAIAGLIDNRVLQTISKIRGLGDIPILGKLFTSRSTRKTTDELLVVVTPRFVRPVPAGEKVELPTIIEPFQIPAKEEVESMKKKKKKGKEGKDGEAKPSTVGPSGYQDPAKKN